MILEAYDMANLLRINGMVPNLLPPVVMQLMGDFIKILVKFNFVN